MVVTPPPPRRPLFKWLFGVAVALLVIFLLWNVLPPLYRWVDSHISSSDRQTVSDSDSSRPSATDSSSTSGTDMLADACKKFFDTDKVYLRRGDAQSVRCLDLRSMHVTKDDMEIQQFCESRNGGDAHFGGQGNRYWYCGTGKAALNMNDVCVWRFGEGSTAIPPPDSASFPAAWHWSCNAPKSHGFDGDNTLNAYCQQHGFSGAAPDDAWSDPTKWHCVS